jgi:hypothetical protein
MPTLDEESEISHVLLDWIRAEALPLDIDLPTTSTTKVGNAVVRSPDILVTNKQTGKSLGIAIKSGVKQLPIGLYPGFKEMQEQFRETNNDFVVVSTIPPSDVLGSNVDEAGIPLFQISRPGEVIDVLKRRLEALAEKNQSAD